MGAG
jgi:integrase